MWNSLFSPFRRSKKRKRRSRSELENQITELQKHNEILQALLSFHNEDDNYEESEKYANTILNNMGDAVFVKDHKSRFLLVNNGFCNLMDLPRTEIIGKTLAENIPPSEMGGFLKIDKQVLSNGIENTTEELLTLEGGEKKIISTRKSRYVDAEGNKFLVGVIRDITKSKQAEQILTASEIKLRELNKTKDRLFSIIAHDLRSPFNNILTLCDILNKSIKNTEVEKSEEYVGLINATAKNTLVLLENLLDWAKSQSGEITFESEKISISEVVHEILKLSRSIAQTKGVTIKVSKLDDIEVFSDKKIIKTIMRNLISNAIKYSEPGGDITISAIEEEDQVKITISDTGVGIDNQTLLKLFGSTTSTPKPGTRNERGAGFGLVLCKEFVEKLGGSIWVVSEEGKGSDFKFTLPLN